MKSLWPNSLRSLSDVEIDKQVERLAPDFLKFLSDRQLPAGLIRELARLYLPLASWLASQSLQALPLIVGVNGAQGSGKSTLCMLLVWLLDHGFGLSCCVVSIDDLYLTRTQRQGLAREIHPLLATRGVPGTHDVELGLRLFETLKCAVADSRTPIPRFDKACDERAPESAWDEFQGRPDLILFEGWCVGAVAQPEALLTAPVNALEANEDGSGVWRSYVNRQLGHEYRALFEQIDLLSMLKIPNWEMVYRWRSNQERQLAASRNGEGIMGSVDLQRFIMHYERLTRYQLEEMPGRADLVLELNRKQEVTQVIKKAATA